MNNKSSTQFTLKIGKTTSYAVHIAYIYNIIYTLLTDGMIVVWSSMLKRVTPNEKYNKKDKSQSKIQSKLDFFSFFCCEISN